MSRSEETKKITLSEVKDRWLEVYSRYTKLTRNGNRYTGLCAFHQEKSPSMNIFNNGAFRCFGCGVSGGSVIDWVMLKEGLSFIDALEWLKKDVTPNRNRIIRPRVVQQKEEVLIEVDSCKFQKRHKDYWNKYLLPESFLNSKEVRAVRTLAYNKVVQNIKDEAVFSYYAKDIGKYKILRIGENVTKKTKWRNTVPNNYIFYFPESRVKNLFIAKSVKDSLCLQYHWGLDSCATQNEDGLILLSNNYERIENIAENKIVTFGNDFQAWHQSLLITEYTNWLYFNIPNYMEQYEVNDVAAMIEHFGKQPLEDLLINKGFL